MEGLFSSPHKPSSNGKRPVRPPQNQNATISDEEDMDIAESARHLPEKLQAAPELLRKTDS
jgi:hypothetical protein